MALRRGRRGGGCQIETFAGRFRRRLIERLRLSLSYLSRMSSPLMKGIAKAVAETPCNRARVGSGAASAVSPIVGVGLGGEEDEEKEDEEPVVALKRKRRRSSRRELMTFGVMCLREGRWRRGSTHADMHASSEHIHSAFTHR